MTRRTLFFASPVLLIMACTTGKLPTAPTSSQSAAPGAPALSEHLGHGAVSPASAANPNPGAHETRGTSMGGSMARRCSFITRSRFPVHR